MQLSIRRTKQKKCIEKKEKTNQRRFLWHGKIIVFKCVDKTGLVEVQKIAQISPWAVLDYEANYPILK